MAGYDAIRRAQIEAVGGSFLRARPWVTAIGASVNAALLATSDVPLAQRLALGGATFTLVAAFAVEARLLARRDPDARWLASSLALTTAALGSACAMSGGATSPLLPLLFAPIAISLAAFGAGPGARLVLSVAALVLALLVLLAAGVVPLPFPAIPAPTAERMTLVGAATSVTLVTIGVSRLADAHRRAGLALERTRAGVLDDALDRARLAEVTGLRVAHELRTPLTSIKALVSLVAGADLEPRQQKRLEVAHAEIERMEALVSDYLSLARPLESLAPRSTELGALIAEVAAVLEGSARDAGVAITVETVPTSLVADARRLREALLNLGTNAIQHLATHTGARRLVLRARPEGGGARVEVEDSGAGLSEGARAALGQPLQSGRAGGLGLGVLLARGVAAQHGGALSFEAGEGGGTRAVIALPAAPPREPEDLGDGSVGSSA
ncbi:MAG: HAMP domain-containing sensor histidine kinase [Sandaracinus sp.]